MSKILTSIDFNSLPSEDFLLDRITFSKNKRLYEYQEQAVESALKVLWLYYYKYKQNKAEMFEHYKAVGLSKQQIAVKEVDVYSYAGYTIENKNIVIEELINRASFWMATGSGKTLVIIKLIEILKSLAGKGIIPQKNILFLTCRDDLIDQFLTHLNEFNQDRTQKITAYNLREYEDILNGRYLFPEKDGVYVFYYRSDLLSDEQKEKILDYKRFGTNWYVILDEAHKGEKEESKRQAIFSALSKDGFLFNFSATFTDELDLITCAHNFNLSEFIKSGYGKKIYLSTTEIQALGDRRGDFSEEQKKAILLKVLIVFALVKIAKTNLGNLYHNPLLMVLGNSVSTEESDLELFFKQLVEVAQGKISDKLFNQVKQELVNELTSGNYLFDLGQLNINQETLLKLTLRDLIWAVFNSEKFGNIEVLAIPGNTQELVFKHTNSDVPFALLKIGDIKAWIKDKLEGYTIIEKFEDESIFRNLNQPEQSCINILLGSRSFYEGWDSNRPNVILYINIGKGKEGKKFVLQSIGRGVRIEPLKNLRQRLSVFNPSQYNQIKESADLLESLFVFGTKARNLQEIVNILRQEQVDEEIGSLFEENPSVEKEILLIPKYKLIDSDKLYAQQRFELTEEEFNLLKNYCNYIGKKLLVIKYDLEPQKVLKLFESFSDANVKTYYKINPVNGYKRNVENLLHLAMKNLTNRLEVFDKFEKLGSEIVHFKHIRISKTKVEQIKEKIEEIKKHVKEFPRKSKTIRINGTSIRYVTQHYYLPLILADEEKLDYFISHVIKTKSEITFLSDLIEYLSDEDNIFKQFEKWYFSKIDETIDEVYIPYYDSENCQSLKFKPDFIFWCKRGKEIYIIFIDPKSTEYAQAYRKIDGYKRLFMQDEKIKDFQFEDKNIKVFLFMYNPNISRVLEEYKYFWIDNFDNIKARIFNNK
ncbi:MAG: DEAD/DEAH box helicase family protein [Candidatus Aenigmatarchaeota archaeon]